MTTPPALSPAAAIRVRKRDGSLEPYDGYEIARSIEAAARGLDDAVTRATQIQAELEIVLFDAITTEQLDETVIQVALQNVKDDPAFDTIAARLLAKTLYKKVFGQTHDLFGEAELAAITLLHREFFPGYVERAVGRGLLDLRLAELFDLPTLAAALDPARDDLLRYVGLQTMRTRYMITDAMDGRGDRRPMEVPQFFWMRVAMGLSLNETDPTAAALGFYDKMSRLDYLAAGSTLVNAGTSYAQLSNCFVMQMEDEIEHIAKSRAGRDVADQGHRRDRAVGHQAAQRRVADPVQQHDLDRPDPVHAHHRLDAAGGLARGQEVRRAVLLPGELAPRLRPVPRPAAELGRPVPAHPDREHRGLDLGRVHEAGPTTTPTGTCSTRWRRRT